MTFQDLTTGRGLTAQSLSGFVDHVREKFGIGPSGHTDVSEARAPDRMSVRALWEASELSADEFTEEVAGYFELPRTSLADMMEARSCASRFSRRFLREAMVFPFETGGGQFSLAVADPTDLDSQRAAQIVLNGPVIVSVASFEEIATALSERLGSGEERSPASDSGASSRTAEESIDSLRDLASGAPVVRAVNDLLEKAIDLRASDIHIEPGRDGLSVRMRVDGLLKPMPAPTHVPARALMSRIKILAGLNIAERRLPQDGAARIEVHHSDLDIRIATMPTQHGEAAVIRLLPRDRGLLDISKLGLRPRDEQAVRRLIDLPHGMIVVTGPTGSGKTTTLATILSMLNTPFRKILTIEDPVEYEIAGVVQSQVKPSIGLTFASALRAFVRQDPDVIMVGEIRDAETAHVAVHAALTGHLVLTTLHTETAVAAVPRLLDLGVEGFLLRSVLRGVVGQRLVRLLCDRCRQERRLADQDFVADPRYDSTGLVPGERVFEARGCDRCGGAGYRGRIGVFEALEVAGAVRDRIGPGVDAFALGEAARRSLPSLSARCAGSRGAAADRRGPLA